MRLITRATWRQAHQVGRGRNFVAVKAFPIYMYCGANSHVQARAAARRGMGKRGVVIHPQVALAPDNRVRHLLFQAKRTP